MIRDHLAAAICGVAVVVRPAMVFSVLALLAILAWRRRQHDARALAVFAAPALLVVLLVANNGLRYGYWGISSITGVTLLSHASRHPEGLREPFTHLAARIRGNQFGGQVLLYARYVEDARPYLEASREIDRAYSTAGMTPRCTLGTRTQTV